MKIELSKREIEAILELMELGNTFLITHGDPQFRECKVSDNKEIPNEKKETIKIININELEEKLRQHIRS